MFEIFEIDVVMEVGFHLNKGSRGKDFCSLVVSDKFKPKMRGNAFGEFSGLCLRIVLIVREEEGLFRRDHWTGEKRIKITYHVLSMRQNRASNTYITFGNNV
jgi:hypothetical protein